jgi:hypothetical protein
VLVAKVNIAVAGLQLLEVPQFLDHFANRIGAVGNGSQASHLAIRLSNSNRNRFGMDIQAQKSNLQIHDRFLSACGSELFFCLESQLNPRPAHWCRSLHCD